jgi:5-methylcytosine-specific restriction endonuclease McrA
LVDYFDGTSLRQFAQNIWDTFVEDVNDPSKGCSLFFVSDSAQAVTERTRIIDSNFHSCVRACLGADVMGAKPTLYFHDDPDSPQGSPAHVFTKQRVSDASSRRSGQSDYSDRVYTRDEGKCVFCDSTENLEAAHVVEIKEAESVDKSVFRTLGLSGFMDTSNGMTLCKPCHEQYDAHYVCLDKESKLVVSNALLLSDNLEKRTKRKNRNNKKVEARSTAGAWITPAALEYRYEVFLRETGKRRTKAAALTHICEFCHAGFKTEKGMQQHIRKGTKCAKEQLKPKQSIRKQQTPKKRTH